MFDFAYHLRIQSIDLLCCSPQKKKFTQTHTRTLSLYLTLDLYVSLSSLLARLCRFAIEIIILNNTSNFKSKYRIQFTEATTKQKTILTYTQNDVMEREQLSDICLNVKLVSRNAYISI